ncbi:MAG: hypothetical protein K0R26_2436 [Bacteroidota bacterium]|jgi:hypothetical protein|nr:hypothetical protein [Bacteroidota bacterium]
MVNLNIDLKTKLYMLLPFLIFVGIAIVIFFIAKAKKKDKGGI